MKIGNIIYTLLTISTITKANANNYDISEFDHRLNLIDLKFKEEGASFNLLNEYDLILNEFDDLQKREKKFLNKELIYKINNIKFKHGIINLILKREKLAFNDFQSCIINNYNNEKFIHNGCFEKYFNIGLKFGKIDLLLDNIIELEGNDDYKLFNKERFNDFKFEIIKYKEKFIGIEQSIENKDWDQCISRCEELQIIGTNDDKLIRYKIECLKNDDIKFKEFDEKIRIISEEYNKLVNFEINEIRLGDFVKFAEIELFGISGIFNSDSEKIIRNCLKIDNDFQECRDLNRINLKFGKIMKLIKEVFNYYSFIYSDTTEAIDAERFKDVELEKEKWEELFQLLFDKNNKVKVNRLDQRAFENLGVNDIDKFNNNFEIIIELFIGIFKNDGFKEEDIVKSQFIKDLFKISKESYFQTNNYKKYKNSILKHKYYSDDNKNNKDVIDIAIELDNYIKKKNFNKAQELLGSISKNLRMSKIIKEREENINEFMRKNQQQQQQQQYYYQQQQQQQRPTKPFTPKNDYYKILGVSKDADENEIKKAYRQKMRENHPDKVKQQLKKEGKAELSEEEIETRVAEINNAYEILSDAEKRDNYDRHGEDPNDPENVQQRQQHQQQQHQQQRGQTKFYFNNGAGFGGFEGNFGGNFGGFGSNFGNFGGFGGAQQQQQQQKQQHQKQKQTRFKKGNYR
jgi:curved DNA-binding protein CbpA